MSEILNANPTIRSVSDLPSRRRQSNLPSTSKTPKGLFASTVPASAYLPDPFSPSTASDSDLSEEEDDAVEPIDEQEIYGRVIISRPSFTIPFILNHANYKLPCLTLYSRIVPKHVVQSADARRPYRSHLRS